MIIYLAGGSGAYKREVIWLSVLKRRLLSFYEILYDEPDLHFHRRAFHLIRKKYQ